jgi:hypothetical protein
MVREGTAIPAAGRLAGQGFQYCLETEEKEHGSAFRDGPAGY